MGNSNWSGGRFWENAEAASIPAATLALSDSIRDQVIGKFATTGDRDTALALLPSGERAGSVANVSGVGLSTYTGTVWKPVASGVLTRCAISFSSGSGTNKTDGNGEGAFLWADNQSGSLTASPFPNGCHTVAISEAANGFDEPLWFKVLTFSASGGSFRAYRLTGSGVGGATRFLGATLPLLFTGTGY